MRPVHPAFRFLSVGLVLIAQSACVKKSTHRVALADLAGARSEVERLEDQVEELEREQRALQEQMATKLQARDSAEATLQAAIRRLTDERDGVERRRATAAERFEEARGEIDRLETLLSQRGSEYQTLQRRLESLRAVEREVRERNAIYEDVIGRFRSLMDGGQLSVAIARGRLVILLPQDVLFESGSATVGREGQTVLSQVGSVLAEFPDRRFQVEGHTDNVPIATARFPSNWELSSARALAVVRLLATHGVDPVNLSGAAYGEFQPVASNDDRESRRRNRRIEIVMLPNLDVIAAAQLPGDR